jgi:hypothetical protein
MKKAREAARRKKENKTKERKKGAELETIDIWTAEQTPVVHGVEGTKMNVLNQHLEIRGERKTVKLHPSSSSFRLRKGSNSKL